MTSESKNEMKLDSEQISSLTEDEIKILQMLGIEIKEKTKRPRNESTLPKEYDLIITKVCRLCGWAESKMYHMTMNWDLRCLTAVEVMSVGEKHKKKTYNIRYCCRCRIFLKSKTQDEVIELLMNELETRFFC